MARRLELLFGGLKVSARVFVEVLQNRRYCLRRSTVPSRSLSREHEREGTSGEGWGAYLRINPRRGRESGRALTDEY